MAPPFRLEPPETMSIEALEEAVRYHNERYFVDDAPEITDYEFDRLVERLKALAPSSPVLTEVGAGTSELESLGAKVEHASPMLSLDKCYEPEELLKWFATVKPGTDEVEGPKFEGDVVVSPKIDGMAMSLKYDADGRLVQGVTRGDGTRGDDVTANIRLVQDIPPALPSGTTGPVEVRGEVYMKLSVFEGFREQFANPRNLTAGTVKQKESSRDKLELLSFFAYDLIGVPLELEREKLAWLADAGFTPIPGEVRPALLEPLQAEYDRILAERSRLDYELDGVVYKVDRLDEQTRLGLTGHHPRYAMAYKFRGDSGTSTLLEVHWNVSRTGAITPVAIIEPVFLSGAYVRRCSLHNLHILQQKGLKLGDTVVAMRRGGVIPHLESSIGGGEEPVTIPDECPSCGGPTVVKEKVLFCADPPNCRMATLGSLEHFAKVLDIDGFGPAIIEKLNTAGLLDSPVDYYQLSVDELLQMELVKETLATKLFDQIQSRRTLSLDTFLWALAIEGVGRQQSRLIASVFGTLEAIREASAEVLVLSVDGLASKTAGYIATFFEEQRGLVDDLLEQVAVTPSTAPRPTPTKTIGAFLAYAKTQLKEFGVGTHFRGVGTSSLAELDVLGSLRDALAATEEELVGTVDLSRDHIAVVVQDLAALEPLLTTVLRYRAVPGRSASATKRGGSSDGQLSLFGEASAETTSSQSADEAPKSAIAGRSFLFTGSLASMGRKDAQRLVEEHGGVAAGSVTATLDYLVVGDKGSTLFGQGKKGSKILKAEKLVAKGAPLQIIPEGRFMEMIDEEARDR